MLVQLVASIILIFGITSTVGKPTLSGDIVYWDEKLAPVEGIERLKLKESSEEYKNCQVLKQEDDLKLDCQKYKTQPSEMLGKTYNKTEDRNNSRSCLQDFWQELWGDSKEHNSEVGGSLCSNGTAEAASELKETAAVPPVSSFVVIHRQAMEYYYPDFSIDTVPALETESEKQSDNAVLLKQRSSRGREGDTEHDDPQHEAEAVLPHNGTGEGETGKECTSPKPEVTVHNTVEHNNMSIPVKILIGEENGITILPLTAEEPPLFLNFTHLKSYSVDFHYTKDLKVFSGNGKILSTREPKVVVSEGVDGPVRLAVDWVHDWVYWVSDKSQTLEISALDGSNRTVLLHTTHFVFPNNIAVDPYRGFLFFVSNHSVYSTDLSGEHLTQIFRKGTNRRGVKCLTLDVPKRTLYFTGRVGNTTGPPFLYSTDYNGQQIVDHPLVNNWTDIYGLGVLDDTVYMAHYAPGQQDTLWSLDLSQASARPQKRYVSPPHREGMWGFRMYHPGVQSQYEV